MTETTINCPKCAGQILCSHELAGREAACPHCGESIILPKTRRTTVWVAVGAVVASLVILSTILVWQHQSPGSPLEELRSKAAKGDTEAMVQLGLIYCTGNDVPANTAEGESWYQKAAELGNSHAMIALGDAFLQKSVEDQALNWYRKAAELGDTNGMKKFIARNSGVDPATGLPSNIIPGLKDPSIEAETTRFTRKLAEAGDRKMQYLLGTAYQYGNGVEKNSTEAVKWYTKAAEQGDIEAQRQLGKMYDDGADIAGDKTEAMKWYTKAAEQGDVWAQYKLGKMHRDGDGGETNFTEAFKWFTKAAEQRVVTEWSPALLSQFNLAWMYRNGQGVPKDAAEAVMLYRKAAEKGSARGQFLLGFMYEAGEGVTQDSMEAAKWYELAAAQGDKDAAAKLARIQSPSSNLSAASKSRGTQAATSGKVEVVSVKTKVTESNDTWWKVSYQLTVKNKGDLSAKVNATLQFLDNEGFVVADKDEYGISLKPGEQKTLSDYTLLNVPVAEKVKRVTATLEEK